MKAHRVLFGALFVVACKSEPPVPVTPDPGKLVPIANPTANPTATTPVTVLSGDGGARVLADIAKANNGFGTDLYGKLDKTSGNLFFSPASLSVALAMAYGGARAETEKAMARTMHLPAGATAHAGYGALIAALSSSPPGPILRVANRLYGDKKLAIEPAFLSLTRDAYHAPLEQVDFATKGEEARASINGWVAKETNDKIQDLIPPRVIDGRTRLILVNAIYFKAKWAWPFKAADTKSEPFFGASGPKDVPMMHETLHAKYGEDSTLQVVELPYADPSSAQALAMDVILPKDKNGLGKVEEKLVRSGLDSVLGALGYGGPAIDLTLPKTKMTVSFELSHALGELGMGAAFGDAADFSGIAKPASPEDRLRIAKVVHKAFVDVNEDGTEAAAATGVAMAAGAAAPALPKVFRADHPFLFLIRDTKSGAVLFMGRQSDAPTTP